MLLFLFCLFSAALSHAQTGNAGTPPPPNKGSVERGGKFIPAGNTNDAAPSGAVNREQAERDLGKDLKIEKIDGNRIRIGLVTLDRAARRVSIPATVQMNTGAVEYALVVESGKIHESVFATKASPRDVHLAMLLLGVKPADAKPDKDNKLILPESSAVTIKVEWDTNGPRVSLPISSMISLAGQDPTQLTGHTLEVGKWLYKGSCFDASGFRVLREGSLISLIGDDAALVNNPAPSHENDDMHVANTPLLPKLGFPVSIVIDCPAKDATPKDATLPPDFLDQLSSQGSSFHFVLPDGKRCVAQVSQCDRSPSGITKLNGTVQHPESGTISLERKTGADGKTELAGLLKFDNTAIEWHLGRTPAGDRFQWTAAPAQDAFRPRNLQMPTAARTGPVTNPAEARKTAEIELKKQHPVVKTGKDTATVGMVEINYPERTARIPAAVNMRSGKIEYALVTEKGKVHESILTTKADAADVHVAMLELGIKPSTAADAEGADIWITPGSALLANVEWKTGEISRSCPLGSWIRFGETSQTPLNLTHWIYGGSRFNGAGFGASTDGSIISLVRDGLALAINPGADRSNDDEHFPNEGEIPPKETPVTLSLTIPPPASASESKTQSP